jgi:hypothetical protein
MPGDGYDLAEAPLKPRLCGKGRPVTSLDDFISQLYAGAIDPTTSYFLPTVVLSQTLPADPLVVADADWGDLAQVAPDLPTRLCAAITAKSICAPATQATMSLTGLQIVGLSNVLPVAEPTVNGRRVDARFAFGTVATLPPAVTVPPQLEVQGTFQVTLTCCSSSDTRTCSGTPAPQPITGTFAVALAGAELSMTLDVDSDFTVTASALSLTARQVLFAFRTASPLLAAGPINSLLKTAFNAQGSQRALTLINGRLAASATLTALSRVLTPAFKSLSSPPLLALVISMLYKNAINPNSSWYLPTKISEATSPVLDPYAAGGWVMPDVGQWYPAAGATICAGIGSSGGTSEIQTPDTAVPLSLSSITISGSSNMLPVPLLTVDDTVSGLIACNAVEEALPKLTVSGDFSLEVACCPSKPPAPTCTGPSGPNVGEGTFTAAFATASVSTAIEVSTSDDELIATVTAVYFRSDPNVDNTANITFGIDITTIPAGNRDVWNSMAAGIFNSPQATSAIVDQIRERLNSDEVRAELSEIVTAAMQQILADDAELSAKVMAEITRGAGHEH